MVTKVVSWNVAKRQEPWRQLLMMDADVALLQEASEPPTDVADRLGIGGMEHWDSHCWNSRWYEGFWCGQPTGIGDNEIWRIVKRNGILYLPGGGSKTTSFSSAFAGISASN